MRTRSTTHNLLAVEGPEFGTLDADQDGFVSREEYAEAV